MRNDRRLAQASRKVTVRLFTVALMFAMVADPAIGEEAAWRDGSPHRVQFVTVEESVRLEVLDWGGRGRPVVLLTGSGNSAHVFDEFAPKLKSFARVYGITRRGHGASSQPESGYGEQRLTTDIVKVLDALQIKSPVLAGHSMAGGEMTTLATEHPERIAGLVYLDALGDPRDFPAADPAYMELFRKLPEALRQPPPGSAEDDRSFAAYRASQMKREGWAFPESELRNIYETTPEGKRGRFRTSSAVHRAIGDGHRKRDYSGIRVPVLAFQERPGKPGEPDPPGSYQPKNAEERAAIEAFNAATIRFIERWVANLKSGVPQARVIELPRAGHFVFLSREAEVLRGMREFVTKLR